MSGPVAMRARARTALGRLRTGAVWGLALLALPNCTLDRSGIVAPHNLERGEFPWTGAVFCEIEKPLRRCASELTDEQRMSAIRLAEAAVALVEGRSTTIGIDDSAEAIVRCGAGGEAVFFEGPFPQGLPVCLNCGVLGGGGRYPDALEVCRNHCYDYYGVLSGEGSYQPDVPPVAEVRAFCDSRTRVAINARTDACLDATCERGTLRSDYTEARRFSEPVVWTDQVGVASGGTAGADLRRDAPATGAFDAGAVSSQWITRGDAYVEFGMTFGHRLGLTQLPPGCAPPCSDTDPGDGAIGFAIAADTDGRVYVYEGGVKVDGPDINGSFGTYGSEERVRIHLRDNGDGSATVSYARIVGSCIPGNPCATSVFRMATARPRYPLRADASLRDAGSTLVDVRFARIR